MSKCIHGHTVCFTCFKAEKEKTAILKPVTPGPKCICSMRETTDDQGRTLFGTDPGCVYHGRFERFDEAFAQKPDAEVRYNGLKYGW